MFYWHYNYVYYHINIERVLDPPATVPRKSSYRWARWNRLSSLFMLGRILIYTAFLSPPPSFVITLLLYNLCVFPVYNMIFLALHDLLWSIPHISMSDSFCLASCIVSSFTHFICPWSVFFHSHLHFFSLTYFFLHPVQSIVYTLSVCK